jgi:capsular exopolysaccharide synthesis family protein
MAPENNGSANSQHPVLLQAANPIPSPWEDGQDESLNETFRVLRKRKWIIIACVAAGLALAVMACVVVTPEYAAVATIELNPDSSGMESAGAASIASALSGDSDLKTKLLTDSTIMLNPSIAMAVIEKLNLRSNKDFQVSGGWSRRKSEVLDAERSHPLEQAPVTRASILQRFGMHLKVEPVRDTRLISITYTSRDSAQAALIANTVVEEYKRQYLQTHYASTEEASQWLTGQLSSLKSKVEDSERRLAEFQRQTGIVGIDQLSQSAPGAKSSSSGGGSFSSPVLQKLATLNDQLSTAEIARVSKEAIYKLVQTDDPGIVGSLASSPLATDSNSAVMLQGGGLTMLTTLQQQRSILKVQYSEAVAKFGAKNPRLIDLKNQISALDGQIKEELEKIKERAKSDYSLSQKVEDGVRRQYTAQQQLANTVNDQAVQFGVLRQEAASNQLLYEDLYTKLQEANISAGVSASNITVVDPARIPAVPVTPNVPLFLGVGLGAGLFLGFSGAFLAESLDRSVVAIEQVEMITHGSVLAVIPDESGPSLYHYGYGVRRQKRQVPSVLTTAPWVISAPNSAVAEACRSLRTSILFSRAGAPPKILGITSSMAGEGKTTVSLNLASAFAQQGARVLLIEADMRRPQLAKVLGLERTTGLSNVLTGTSDLKDAVVECTSVPNLSVMLSGPRPPMPAELLGSARFGGLIQTVSKAFDFILIDTPPATLVTDAVLVSHSVDGMVCVVRAHVATRPGLLRFSELLRKNKCPILGYVLNAVDTRSADYSHYYGYSGKSDYYTEGNT